MSTSYDVALAHAVQIVTAAANNGGLKLGGPPMDASQVGTIAKRDGEYIATLLKTIANTIKTI